MSSPRMRHGSSLATYAMVVAAIALVVFAAVSALGVTVSGFFDSAATLNGSTSGDGGEGGTGVDLAAFEASAPSTVAGGDIVFTATSPDALTYEWDFGDPASGAANTSTENPVLHTFATAGTYTVTLTVNGPGGPDTETMDVTVLEAPPTANFTFAPSDPDVDETVAFSDTSGGVVDTYEWDFGDGDADTVQNPDHAYDAAGTYTVTLTVTGPGGTDVASQDVTVVEPAPAASFTVSASPTTYVNTSFTNTSTDATSYSWDFGDGGTSTSVSPNHAFMSAGTFTVTLTATGPGGTDTHSIDVNVAQGPPIASFSLSSSGCANSSGVLTRTVNGSGSLGESSYSWTAVRTSGSGSVSVASPTAASTNLNFSGIPLVGQGIFQVTLTVTGPGGTDNHQLTTTVRGANNPLC